MLSNEINDNYQGGQFKATLEGTITGLIHGPGWTAFQVDVGLPGGSIIQLRLTDDDPIEIEATEVPQPLVPAPLVDEAGNPLTPDLDATEPTPEAGE